MKSLVHTTFLTTSLLTLAPGCSSREAASSSVAEPPPTARCPDVSRAAGTRHPAADIVRDEAWLAKDGPHLVDGDIVVQNGATLVVEPCVEIRMAAGASLRAGQPSAPDVAKLVLHGAADAPIRFLRQGGEPWGALAAFAPATMSLRHVQLSGGGGDHVTRGATLFGAGRNTTPLESPVSVEAVSISNGAGPGVMLDAAAAFGAGSKELTISSSGSEALPYPLVIGAHALGSVPSGTYRGNRSDAVLVRVDAPNALPGLQVDAVVRPHGVPYVVGEAPGEGLRVGANGGPPVTLTLEAGTELRFRPEAFLRIVSDAERAIGQLKIEGTKEAPVRLTSAAASPKPGDWSGLYFEAPMRDHVVRYAEVSFAGGYCSCSLSSCSPLTAYDAAVILDGRPKSAFFHDSTIAGSAGHGFVRSWQDAFDLDFTASNRFVDVAGCPQTAPERSDVTCPSPADACR